MPTDTSVKFFQNTMSGAPTLPNTAGTLIALLDACLVNGFGSVTLNSMVIADNVATGTVSTGHGFAMTGATGPVIRIEGATPSGLNGDWRIQTVPNSTTFTFTTTGISNQTATGTITAKRAPAGFEKVFSATGKAVYRALDEQSTRWFLRINDTSEDAEAWASVRMFETMTDVDTGTNDSTTYFVLKSKFTGNKAWRVYADARAVYFVGDTNDVGGGHFFFGDLANPSVIADSGHCGLLAYPSAVLNGTSIAAVDHDTSGQLAISYNGIARNVALRRRGHVANTTVVSDGGGSYVANIGVLVKAVEAWEGSGYYRGIMPGWYGQVHANLGTWNGAYYEHPQIGTLRGDQLHHGAGNYNQFFDVTGPWR